VLAFARNNQQLIWRKGKEIDLEADKKTALDLLVPTQKW
jgi:hypothetical protein